MQITSFSEARAALASYMPALVVGRKAYSLETMQQLLSYLGNPQERFKTIHVAGTSGKTSTAYYAAAFLRQTGVHVGLTVSPHTVEVNDRVQIDGVPLAEAAFCSELSIFLDMVTASGLRPTYFELMVAFAFWEFARREVTYAVVEVGLGGLLDATNMITRPDKVAVITDIGLDHTAVLGSTLAAIAEQKAGIIQNRNTVFMYQQDSEVMQAIKRRAQQKQADCHILTSRDAIDQPALPPFQRRNSGLALAAARCVLERDGAALTPGQITAALRTHIPGRMELFVVRGKHIILDGAHNAQKIAALCEGIRDRYPDKQIASLMGIVDNREGETRAREVLTQLGGISEYVVVTQFSGPQDGPNHGMAVGELLNIAKVQGVKPVHAVVDPQKAFEMICQSDADVVVITGSLYLLNHIRPLALQAAH
jgi:dihydrofolate synthase/folylpolyglutamate synthase